MFKNLDNIDVQVIKSALDFFRKALVRRRTSAVSDGMRSALGKDIEVLDKVIAKG